MSTLLRALATDARVARDDHDEHELGRVLADLIAYQNWWDAFDARQGDPNRPFARDEFKETDHPRDEGGKFSSTGGGASAGSSESFSQSSPPPASLNGVAFKSWKPPTSNAGWEKLAEKNPKIEAPPPPPLPSFKVGDKTFQKSRGAGVIIQEPDGRVWVMHPTKGYGGYNATYPKGTQDKGLSLRATAIKEAYEETGLRVELTGYAADVDRDTSVARYYFARRIDGTPADHGPEAEKVTLSPVADLHQHLNRSVDRTIAEELLGMPPQPKPAKASPKPPEPPPETAKEKPKQTAAPKPPEPKAKLSTANMKGIGGKLGSNPGGRYQDKNGKQYYVKQSKSADHAKNELLAARLYEAAGSPVLNAQPIDVGGKLGTATEWQKVTPIDRKDKAQREEAQQDFATHAWLANWDAAGLDYDNQGRVGGKMTTLDPGGSLLYRAQGGPKGAAFGDKATEWDSLRSPSNHQAHTIYGEMTPAQLKASAQKVASVSDAKIRDLVDEHGPGTADERKSLAAKLIARKRDIAKRAGIDQAQDEFRESDHPRAPNGEFGSGSGASAAAAGAGEAAKPRLAPLKPGAKLPPHIAALKIPPAWTDVHYAENPGAHLLVVGRDTKGRPVSIYAPSHHAKQSAAKFARVKELAAKFDQIAKQNDAAKKDPEKRDVAEALDLVMKMGIRPGSDRDTGAEKQAYGATTLEGRHVRVSPNGHVSLAFTGKKGVDLRLPVEDRKLAAMLSRRKQKAGNTGRIFGDVTAEALRAHAHEMNGGDFSTKDFRTHLGTQTAMAEIASRETPTSETAYKRAVREVGRVVAERLGNTPTVALASYISPTVFAHWRSSAGL